MSLKDLTFIRRIVYNEAERKNSMKAFDLTGEPFGRWKVLARAENSPQGQAQWLCRCECGNEKIVKSIILRRNLSRSCGCLKADVCRERVTTHGHSRPGQTTPTYHTWAGMVARCTNPKHQTYHLYGGAGVTVCERWLTFANFLEDMGEKPPGTSLDRIQGSRIYDKPFCRWATPKEQGRNKSNNRLLTFQGETLTMAEWAERLEWSPATISHRVNAGWSDEDALTISPETSMESALLRTERLRKSRSDN